MNLFIRCTNGFFKITSNNVLERAKWFTGYVLPTNFFCNFKRVNLACFLNSIFDFLSYSPCFNLELYKDICMISRSYFSYFSCWLRGNTTRFHLRCPHPFWSPMVPERPLVPLFLGQSFSQVQWAELSSLIQLTFLHACGQSSRMDSFYHV